MSLSKNMKLGVLGIIILSSAVAAGMESADAGYWVWHWTVKIKYTESSESATHTYFKVEVWDDANDAAYASLGGEYSCPYDTPSSSKWKCLSHNEEFTVKFMTTDHYEWVDFELSDDNDNAFTPDGRLGHCTDSTFDFKGLMFQFKGKSTTSYSWRVPRAALGGIYEGFEVVSAYAWVQHGGCPPNGPCLVP